jgi:Mn2+/Fe2+ NRAMP family transporter
MRWTKYFVVRFLIVCIIFLLSMCIPNLNLLLTLSGSLLGTLVNVYFPALFYLRAYNGSDKNQNLEVDGEREVDPEEKNRKWVKCWAVIMIIFGTIVGIWGLAYVIYELYTGGAESDEV